MNNSRRESVGMTSDVTEDVIERRRPDEAMRWNEERYRTLFDLGPVAVYSCDAGGVIQEYNHRAAELWGREPAVGDTDKRFCGSFKLFRPDGRFMPHEQCPMAEVVAGTLSEARDAEVLIERPDGSRITVVVNIRPLKNERDDIIGAINCFYDVTARKQTEEALRDSDRRKSEFLAMLAHELRNPLAPIRHSLEVLRRSQKVESSTTPGQEPRRTQPAPATRPTPRWMSWTGRSDKWCGWSMTCSTPDASAAGRWSFGRSASNCRRSCTTPWMPSVRSAKAGIRN